MGCYDVTAGLCIDPNQSFSEVYFDNTPDGSHVIICTEHENPGDIDFYAAHRQLEQFARSTKKSVEPSAQSFGTKQRVLGGVLGAVFAGGGGLNAVLGNVLISGGAITGESAGVAAWSVFGGPVVIGVGIGTFALAYSLGADRLGEYIADSWYSL